MTSHRGTLFGLLCVIAIALPAVIVLAARVAHGAIASDAGTSEITTPSVTATPATGGTSAVGAQMQSNLADSANQACENYIYPLACRRIDPRTGRKGGQNCPCTTARLPGGPQISGSCVFDREKGKGVCRANVQTAGLGGNATPGAGTAPSQPATPVAGSVAPTQQTQPVAPSVGGTNGVLQTNPYGAASPSTAATPGPSAGGPPVGTYSPASSISTIAGYSTGFSESPLPTGSNWMNLAAYQNALNGAYYLSPANIPVASYPPTPGQTQPQIVYPMPQITFSNASATNPRYRVVGIDAVLKIIYGSPETLTSVLNRIYASLAGFPDNTLADLPSTTEPIPIVNPVFDTSIVAENPTVEQSIPTPPRGQTTSVNLRSQSAKEAAQQVRDSLKELRMTVESAMERSATSTEENINSATTTANASSTASATVATERAKADLDAAEVRAEKLANELESNSARLDQSNTRVQELTQELNALNERIKAANQQMADKSLDQPTRLGLLFAIIENVQLALADAERRLEQATAKAPPKTVGQVVITGFTFVVTGFADWTVILSQGLSNFIQSMWHALFPAY